MSRSFRFPAYPRKPHSSGQARIRISGEDVYLGVHGSEASKLRYAELAAQSVTAAPASKKAKANPSIREMLAQFLVSASTEMPEKELWHFTRIAKVLIRLHGSERAAAFDANALANVRRALAAGTWLTEEERKHPKAGEWSRNQINKAAIRIKRIWRWGEQQKMLPAGSWAGLAALQPIKSTDRSFRNTKPRAGVEWEVVQAVLNHLPGAVAAMVEIQWWTGMRPAEVCKMTPGKIEEVDGNWLFWLSGKNSWRPGREREAVILGPEAMRVLLPWFAAAKSKGPDAPIFPSTRTGQQYTTGGYAQALAGAFEKHPALVKFVPYSLRHAAKRRIKRSHGLDAARAVLRQSSILTTDKYDAERDMILATETAKKTG